MNGSYFYRLGLLVLAILVHSSYIVSDISTKDIINKMKSSCDKVVTLKYKLKKTERIAGVMSAGEQDVKFQRVPKKVYTKIISPNKGVEVLFLEGENQKKAYVNPNGFPYMTVSLDPYSSTMRNKNHHTIHEVGFDYINGIISHIADKSKDNFNKYFLNKGDTVFNGRSCYKILIDYTPYAYENYTVKSGENVIDIAYKLFVSDYMILQLNKGITDYKNVKPGQVIKVPNAYARKTVMFIDKINHLPIVQRMYDEKGLYAQYEFYNVEYNPKIPAEEFTKEYKDYNF